MRRTAAPHAMSLRIGTSASSSRSEPALPPLEVVPQPMIRAEVPTAQSAVSPGVTMRVGAAATGSLNVSTATSFVCPPASSA